MNFVFLDHQNAEMAKNKEGTGMKALKVEQINNMKE